MKTKKANKLFMEQVKSKSYTLYGNNREWLGQVILTTDGMFASVTDYGNLSYAWRAYGDKDFRQFICGLNAGYFATKLYTGMAYMLYSKKCERACNRFAEMILPALQEVIRADIELDPNWTNESAAGPV